MVRKKILLLIDILFIFLNLANYYTILCNIILTDSRGYNTLILFILNAVYLFLRFKKRVIFIRTKDSLFILYIVLFISNIISSLISSTLIIGFELFFLLNISFYVILQNIYSDYALKKGDFLAKEVILKGYCILMIINMVSVCVMQIMIIFANFNPLVNDITFKYDLFDSNVLKFNANYFFPYCLSIVSASSDLRIPILQENGMVLGFFHEPHTLMFFLTPAFLLLLPRLQRARRIILIVLYVFVLLSCASTTSIISVIACYILYLCIRYRSRILILIISLSLLFIMFVSLDEDLYQFIILKFQSGSADYSLSTLKFAFEPRSLWGTNFFDLTYWDKGVGTFYDVGYVCFIINILFLTIFIFRIIKLIFSKDSMICSIGFSALYFLMHSSKQAMVTYSIPLLPFIMFLTFISIRNNDYNKNITK